MLEAHGDTLGDTLTELSRVFGGLKAELEQHMAKEEQILFPMIGQGAGQIWLDGVSCDGDEARLDECRHPGWGNEDCGHAEDAGVRCLR